MPPGEADQLPGHVDQLQELQQQVQHLARMQQQQQSEGEGEQNGDFRIVAHSPEQHRQNGAWKWVPEQESVQPAQPPMPSRLKQPSSSRQEKLLKPDSWQRGLRNGPPGGMVAEGAFGYSRGERR